MIECKSLGKLRHYFIFYTSLTNQLVLLNSGDDELGGGDGLD
jgi:hypothetical protein